jgi:hypothetical protein
VEPKLLRRLIDEVSARLDLLARNTIASSLNHDDYMVASGRYRELYTWRTRLSELLDPGDVQHDEEPAAVSLPVKRSRPRSWGGAH